MKSSSEQPLVGSVCVTTLITAAKETRLLSNIIPGCQLDFPG